MTTTITQQKLFYKYKCDLDFLEKAAKYYLLAYFDTPYEEFETEKNNEYFENIMNNARALLFALLFFNLDDWTDRKIEVFRKLAFILGID